MEITSDQKSDILNKVQSARSLEDLVSLLNVIIAIQSESGKSNYKSIPEKKLKFYYAHLNERYLSFEIPKKTGGNRSIDAPDKFLKKIQRRIDLLIRLFHTPKPPSHGFETKRSIVSNAQVHVGKKYVLNVDLKDFFPSIHFGRVRAILQLAPLRMTPEFAHIIANICCYKGILPQGAPTSPILTNLVSQRLDYKLVGLARETHCFYTRYADDITFSSDKPRFDEAFIEKLKDLISSEGFTINDKKTRVQKKSIRQEVTGVIVNEKLNVPRKYIRNVRAMLHNWEKLGYERAVELFQKSYPKEKGFLKNKTIPAFENVLSGKIMFLGMVRGENDPYSRKFKGKYTELMDIKISKNGT